MFHLYQSPSCRPPPHGAMGGPSKRSPPPVKPKPTVTLKNDGKILSSSMSTSCHEMVRYRDATTKIDTTPRTKRASMPRQGRVRALAERFTPNDGASQAQAFTTPYVDDDVTSVEEEESKMSRGELLAPALREKRSSTALSCKTSFKRRRQLRTSHDSQVATTSVSEVTPHFPVYRGHQRSRLRKRDSILHGRKASISMTELHQQNACDIPPGVMSRSVQEPLQDSDNEDAEQLYENLTVYQSLKVPKRKESMKFRRADLKPLPKPRKSIKSMKTEKQQSPSKCYYVANIWISHASANIENTSPLVISGSDVNEPQQILPYNSKLVGAEQNLNTSTTYGYVNGPLTIHVSPGGCVRPQISPPPPPRPSPRMENPPTVQALPHASTAISATKNAKNESHQYAIYDHCDLDCDSEQTKCPSNESLNSSHMNTLVSDVGHSCRSEYRYELLGEYHNSTTNGCGRNIYCAVDNGLTNEHSSIHENGIVSTSTFGGFENGSNQQPSCVRVPKPPPLPPNHPVQVARINEKTAKQKLPRKTSLPLLNDSVMKQLNLAMQIKNIDFNDDAIESSSTTEQPETISSVGSSTLSGYSSGRSEMSRKNVGRRSFLRSIPNLLSHYQNRSVDSPPPCDPAGARSSDVSIATLPRGSKLCRVQPFSGMERTARIAREARACDDDEITEGLSRSRRFSRPKSEIDPLVKSGRSMSQFRSDIQLNLAEKVHKFCSKVSSKQPKRKTMEINIESCLKDPKYMTRSAVLDDLREISSVSEFSESTCTTCNEGTVCESNDICLQHQSYGLTSHSAIHVDFKHEPISEIVSQTISECVDDEDGWVTDTETDMETTCDDSTTLTVRNVPRAHLDYDDDDEEDEDYEVIDAVVAISSEVTSRSSNFESKSSSISTSSAISDHKPIPKPRMSKLQSVNCLESVSIPITSTGQPAALVTVNVAEEPYGVADSPSVLAIDEAFSNTNLGLNDDEKFDQSTESDRIYDSRFAFSEPMYQHYHNYSIKVKRMETVTGGESRAQLTERICASSGFGSQRGLWCELPQVKRSGLLDSLGDRERKQQEAMFEVISSEASYVRSLNVLITHFMASPKLSGTSHFGSVITKQDRKMLFGNIMAVRDCSQRFLDGLFSILEEDLVLKDVCSKFITHAANDEFNVYIAYCSNQSTQEKLFERLRSENEEFATTISELSRNVVCQNLSFRSFLLLPMQRVTRYRLLMEAIFHRIDQTSEIYEVAKQALAWANKIVSACNEEARRVSRFEQLIDLEAKIHYRKSDKRLALVSASRWLVKRGELVQLLSEKLPRSRKGVVSKSQRTKQLYLFLFTDFLVVTEPSKRHERFVAIDHCARNMVDVHPIDFPEQCQNVNQAALSEISSKSRFLFSCTLIENVCNRPVELILNAESEADRSRWIEAFSPPRASDPTEQIYDSWDCPQVMVINNYIAQQEDELTLVEGDVINVLRKTQDVWSEGERLRDCCRGWFPITYTQEIVNDHVRARNYKERLRVMQAMESLRQHSADVQPMQGIGFGTLKKLSKSKKLFSS